MFTKYNGITLPQNYSGNRFKSYPNDTEMKTHRAKEALPSTAFTKTSVSPTYQELVGNIAADEEPWENPQADFVEKESAEQAFSGEDEKIIDTPPDKNENQPTFQLSELLSKSGVGKLLNGLHNDDILLLALILILAQDNGEQSPDAILLLALLLLFR